jgi:pimeloyl-ACP methyl ester carboxylesterase
VVPRGCIDEYKKAIPRAQVATIEGVGHRPEIENSTEIVKIVSRFLAS